MGKRYLIDTNIIIYFLKNEIPETSSSIIQDIFNESFNVSIITMMEFLGWNGFTEKEYNEAASFINGANIIELTSHIGEKAISLMRGKNLKLPDASIAATAIVENLTLVTRNEKDFDKIEEIPIYNPFL